MSLLISTDISCDGDCGQWTEGTTGVRTNARTARKAAKRAGWTRKGGNDYCPRCSKKEGTEHASKAD